MAYYSDELIEEVISQNDIVDVVSEYVTLKKSGRNYMGLCPFHREKSPSFCVSIDKQIFKCFGCGEGGNVISFIMKIEKMEFSEALEFLAERANIDLSKYEINNNQVSSKKEKEIKDLKQTIYNLDKDAAIYYNNALIEKLKDNTSLISKYIEKRKLDLKTITKFGLGFGRGSVPILEYLLKKGYSKEDIYESGIIVKTERNTDYDRFDNRLIFPIFDVRDRVIGFGGRVLDDSKPKYVNSPENVVYSKGRNLYALNFAKKEKLDNIVMVEGYMDVVSVHKYGVNNVVASLGTALTENQARLLKKYSDNVIIGYDQDSAGQAAILRGLDILVAKGLNVKVLKLDKQDAKDPDEYINKYGVEKFQNCIKNSISLVEFKISKLQKELDLNNFDEKVKFLTETANILSKIDNNIEREMYIDIISKNYAVDKEAIKREINKKDLKSKNDDILIVDESIISKKIQKLNSNKKVQEQYVIALMLSKDKKIREQILNNIDVSDIENENIQKIYKTLIELNNSCDLNKIDILTKITDEDLVKEITEIMYIELNGNKEKLVKDVIKNIRKNKYKKRRQEIIERLSHNITKDEQELLQFELNQIILELSKLK